MPIVAIAIDFALDLRLRKLRQDIRKSRQMWLKASAKLVHKEAKSSIRKGRAVSKPGDPPIGKSGNLKKSIRYKVGRQDAWIGPTWPLGAHGNILEGGSRQVAARPYMGPALERSRPKIRKFRKI